MNTNKPNKNDERLISLLRAWKVTATLPPRFQEQVWQRIVRQDTQPAFPMSVREFVVHWIGTALPRPALAVSYLAIRLILVAGVGWTQVRPDCTWMSQELSLRYVNSIDPYQNVR